MSTRPVGESRSLGRGHSRSPSQRSASAGADHSFFASSWHTALMALCQHAEDGQCCTDHPRGPLTTAPLTADHWEFTASRCCRHHSRPSRSAILSAPAQPISPAHILQPTRASRTSLHFTAPCRREQADEWPQQQSQPQPRLPRPARKERVEPPQLGRPTATPYMRTARRGRRDGRAETTIKMSWSPFIRPPLPLQTAVTTRRQPLRLDAAHARARPPQPHRQLLRFLRVRRTKRRVELAQTLPPPPLILPLSTRWAIRCWRPSAAATRTPSASCSPCSTRPIFLQPFASAKAGTPRE